MQGMPTRTTMNHESHHLRDQGRLWVKACSLHSWQDGLATKTDQVLARDQKPHRHHAGQQLSQLLWKTVWHCLSWGMWNWLMYDPTNLLLSIYSNVKVHTEVCMWIFTVALFMKVRMGISQCLSTSQWINVAYSQFWIQKKETETSSMIWITLENITLSGRS